LSISKAAIRGSKDAPTNLNVKKFMINPGTDKNLHRVRGWIFFPLRIEFETRNFEIENSLFSQMNQFQSKMPNYTNECGKLLLII